MNGALDQVAAVVEGLDAHALWQQRRDLIEPLAHAGHQLRSIGAAQAEYQSLDRLAPTAGRDRAVAGQTAEAHRGHIRHSHQMLLVAVDHDGAHIVERLQGALGAHQQGLLAVAEATGAVVAVVVAQGGLEIGQTQTVGAQARQVGHHLEGFDQSAKAVDVGHARHAAQRRTEGPVQCSPAFGKGLRALDREHEHLAQRRCEWRKATLGARRQILHDAAKAFGHLLARPVDVGAFLEIHRDVSECILRARAKHLGLRQSQQTLLDRRSDARLDLLRRHARRL